jgi:hypothetical protein
MHGGGCHDQADAEWIEIRKPLGGHNDTPFGQPTPGQPIGRPRVGPSQGIFGVFSYYHLVMLFLNMVCLIVAAALTILVIFTDAFIRTVFQRAIQGVQKHTAIPHESMPSGQPSPGQPEG